MSADTVTPKVFRSFRPWDRYIDINMFADTRTLPEMGDFPFWKKDTFYFENSISIAFEGNRIATIMDVTSSEEKVIIKYKLSEDEYTITDYQYDRQGTEYKSTAIVFYFLRSETMDLKQKEVVFLLDKTSVKQPRPNPSHSVQNKTYMTKKVDMSGRSISERKTSGIYLVKSARFIFKKVEIR